MLSNTPRKKSIANITVISTPTDFQHVSHFSVEGLVSPLVRQ